ncbi:hypothetical protein NESM_000091100 [Novymonas esmeraldas]|uniref:Uncharacterized protein n=1 Tax=Novymonas esmeraldas TaxID=1808958 RepID=A0AAW0F3J6_9TRYP
MSTALFELFGQLATSASGRQHGASPGFTMAPPQILLPTEEECMQHGHKKPLVFLYDPKLQQQQQQGSGAADGRVSPGVGAAAPSSPSTRAVPSVQGGPAELCAALLAAPGTSVQALRVTSAEDDLHTTLSSQEVWSDWPSSIRGWQLCPMSHLCAVAHTGSTAAAAATVAAAAPSAYLLASRYELVGTSAVYERYLLLAPSVKGSTSRSAPQGFVTHAAPVAAAAAAVISVAELRTLRRVACLCRCFCTGEGEAQPRGGAAHVSGGPVDTLAPPPPLADYVLHLAPTSLHYTFCWTTTALLRAADEERCQAWAMTATALSRLKFGSRHRSCSATDAANTSGALSDAGHTTYMESASQSRDRSTSTMRMESGGVGGGISEDPRSAVSTPARPPPPPHAMSRAEEQLNSPVVGRRHEDDAQQQQQQQQRGSDGSLEERLPPSQRWRAMALRRLLDRSFYDEQVPAGWQRWRYASSGILCRPLVVDSLDGIVRYIHGSRLAFYTAVAFLDRFIAATVDPVANFLEYRHQIQRTRTRQELDCRMLAIPGQHGGNPRSRPHVSGLDDAVRSSDICAFLTQVIVVCTMLGSKTVDLYPPRIRSLMGCVEDTAPISEHAFVVLEFHVLLTLGFPVHPVTLFEAAGALLTFSTSDGLYAALTTSHTTRRLLEEHQDRGHLIDNVERLLQEELEEEEAAAVGGAAAAAPAAARAAAAGLTVADRHSMSDWLRLRLFTFFICEEVLRADVADSASVSSSSASSSSSSACNGSSSTTTPRRRSRQRRGGDAEEEEEERRFQSDRGLNVLQLTPVLVAAAALVTAAEQLRMPLPAPLRRLLPASLQTRLREAPADGISIATHSSASSTSGGVGGVGTAADAAAAAAASRLRLTAAPSDDHYGVLVELSLLLEQELCRLADDDQQGRLPVSSASAASTTPPIAHGRAEEEEEEVGAPVIGGGGRAGSAAAAAALASTSPCPTRPHSTAAPLRGGGAARRLAPLFSPSPQRERPVSVRAVNLFSHVIALVRTIHHKSRESCPPVLLQRYQSLFRDGA